VRAVANHIIDKPWSGLIDGGIVVLRSSSDRDEEASWVVGEVRRHIAGGTPPGGIVILARRRSRLEVVEPALALEIPTRSDPREVWTPPEERVLIVLAFIKDWRAEALATDAATTYLVRIAGLDPDAVREFEQECLRKQAHPGDVLQFGPWR